MSWRPLINSIKDPIFFDDRILSQGFFPEQTWPVDIAMVIFADDLPNRHHGETVF